MRRGAVAALALLSACYRTSEWGATGEYRANHSKMSEQQVGTTQTAQFDERDGIHVSVMSHGLCRPLLAGDQIEQEETAKRELTGTGAMVGVSLGLGAIGAFGILFAAADANNTDIYGNPLPSRLSSDTRTELIVSGSILTAIAIAGIVAVIELPDQKVNKRWVPVEGNPNQIFTSDEPGPCSAPATPASGVAVHVEVHFRKGEPYAWDVKTDASGMATIDLTLARQIAGYCGDGTATAKVTDQSWSGPVEATQKLPLDQIADEQARAAATACQAQ